MRPAWRDVKEILGLVLRSFPMMRVLARVFVATVIGYTTTIKTDLLRWMPPSHETGKVASSLRP